MLRATIAYCLLLLPAFGLAGCSDTVSPEEATPVPIRLYAGGEGVIAGNAETKADTGLGTTLFGSETMGSYLITASGSNTKSLWMRDATIAAGSGEAKRAITFTDSPAPVYPSNGDWIYLVGVSPAVTSATDGKVTYTIDGTTDILYASEIKGNKWNYGQFGDAEGKYLKYTHKLTKLEFIGKIKDSEGLEKLTVTEIKIKNVANTADLQLSDGTLLFSNQKKVVSLSSGLPSATLTTGNTSLGYLLLPAVGNSYEVEVATSYGSFSGMIQLEENNNFAAGSSHAITFTFTGKGLTVTSVAVEGWQTTTPSGGDNLPVN